MPLEIAPCDNLTRRMSGIAHAESPFDGDRQYEQFFESLARSLNRTSSRHVLIRRRVGVGDHAVLTAFAQRIAGGRYPGLSGRQLITVDCRFIPADESRERMIAIAGAVAQHPGLIVCLDGVPALLEGGPEGNVKFMLSLLPRLACQVIGTLAPDEYESYFAGREGIDEFFSVLELSEPAVESAKRIVGHYALGLEHQYGIKIAPDAVDRAVVLTDSYVPSKRLPSKAIGVLREICEDISFDRAYAGSDQASATEADVIEKIAHISGVPASTLSGLGDGVDYAEALGMSIVGQDHVIEEVATELGLIRAGLLDPGKPASVMMFIGQTGTGKTELAKVIAKLYSASKRLKTFTLGNYSEAHSVSGIIGVPPGYVGHDHGGRLVNELNADPYSVFLLDEADKAHPDVMQPFLNLFDQGWIIDQRGNKAFADRAIFILTTNIGQRQIADMHGRGQAWSEINSKLRETLSMIRHTKSNRPVFTAEFLARIKRVIVFKPLDAEAMQGIARCVIDAITIDWLEKRQKRLVVDTEIVERIGQMASEQNQKSKGKEGGRIVRKLFADLVEAKIQQAISRSPAEYQSCSTVMVSSDEPNDTVSGLVCEVEFHG